MLQIFSCVRFFFGLGFLLLLFHQQLLAQSSGIPLNAPAYDLIQRLEIKTGLSSPMHPELKYYSRRDAVHYALSLDSLKDGLLTRLDRADLRYLMADNHEWLSDSSQFRPNTSKRGWLKYFYTTPANLFEVNTPSFHLRVNPLLNLQIGLEAGDEKPLFQNQRGLELSGDLDEKLFFYTNLVESQGRYPSYVRQRVGEYRAVPGAGFFKGFKSQLLDIQDAYDFNVATAYIGFQASRHFGIQFGHGKHFIGNGYRSMFLSDFGAPTFFLKFDTRVWRFHYQNLFLELSPVSQVDIPDGTILPKKYVALHYLNLKVTPGLSFGLFEATVFNRSRHFELQYLNPVVFYRTVEGMIGSPDNVLLGLDGRWNFYRGFQLYGQVLLDELVTGEVFSGSGWWANKWSFQTGLKYVNAFGIDHLDLQLEHNRVRPYTYAHSDPANSYTHYNQVLAHPLGANFEETLLLLRWQPYSRLTFQARIIHSRIGENTAASNWGGDPLLNYNSRVQDYGNWIGQGIKARINLLGLDATWAFGHNLFMDLKFIYRKKDSEDDARDVNTPLFSTGFRMNMWAPNLDF